MGIATYKLNGHSAWGAQAIREGGGKMEVRLKKLGDHWYIIIRNNYVRKIQIEPVVAYHLIDALWPRWTETDDGWILD